MVAEDLQLVAVHRPSVKTSWLLGSCCDLKHHKHAANMTLPHDGFTLDQLVSPLPGLAQTANGHESFPTKM